MRAGKLLTLILTGSLALGLAGCGEKKADTSDSTASPAESAVSGAETAEVHTDVSGKRVGIAMPTQSLERWNRDGAYLEQHFQSEGCATTLVFSDNDAEQQAADVAKLIGDGCDLLVISAIDDDSLADTLAAAKEAGIPVIAYDRLIKGTDAVSYYVSYDNYKVGQLQGRYIIEALGLKTDDTSREYHIEFTAGDPGDNNAGYFYNGAYDTLKPYLDAGVLTVPSGQTTFAQVSTELWDSDAACDRMKGILAQYYGGDTQLDAALCSNDSTALGVTRAIDSDYGGKNTVVITGQDGDEANLANIRSGKQSMTVYKALENEAVVTLDLGRILLEGDPADANLIADSGWEFECAYDTSSYDNGTGIIPAYLLAPTVITADNVGSISKE